MASVFGLQSCKAGAPRQLGQKHSLFTSSMHELCNLIGHPQLFRCRSFRINININIISPFLSVNQSFLTYPRVSVTFQISVSYTVSLIKLFYKSNIVYGGVKQNADTALLQPYITLRKPNEEDRLRSVLTVGMVPNNESYVTYNDRKITIKAPKWFKCNL